MLHGAKYSQTLPVSCGEYNDSEENPLNGHSIQLEESFGSVTHVNKAETCFGSQKYVALISQWGTNLQV